MGTMDLTQESLMEKLQKEFKDGQVSLSVNLGELMVTCAPEFLRRCSEFLKTKCNFEQLIDICGVDHLEHGKHPRFEVVYNLLSMKHNLRIRIKVPVEGDGPVPSLVSIYKASGWFEREAFDLMGIFFSDHPDLRRILTDYTFEGHPLRKDFPMEGHDEVRYDPIKRKVVYHKARLPQENRLLNLESNKWKGTDSLFGRFEMLQKEMKKDDNEHSA